MQSWVCTHRTYPKKLLPVFKACTLVVHVVLNLRSLFMEINPKVLWKQKEEELKKEGIKNPVLDRTIDSYFKYLVKDTVLDKIAKSIIKRLFDEDIENVSEALSPEFQVAYNQRDFKLDVVCQADDIFLGLDMQKSAYPTN